jgi:hypothetical protein
MVMGAAYLGQTIILFGETPNPGLGCAMRLHDAEMSLREADTVLGDAAAPSRDTEMPFGDG